MTNRPNFLFIITDQHRADYLGCSGHPVLRTPHLDSVAARGRRFDRFYVANPVCQPNRATLMTGRMPSLHGVRHNGISLSLRSNTFVDLLRANGYRTALLGKSHLQNFETREPIMQRDPRVKRLFDDYQAEEEAYFKRTGIYPIMHVTAIRQELVEAHPWLPTNLMQAFEKSKAASYARLENPRIVPLAWYRHYLDREREILGPDAWEYGLGDSNRNNLETAIMYSHDSGLISRLLTPDEIFIDPSSGRGRGGKRI